MSEHHWDPRREIRELRARVEHAFRQAAARERSCRPAGRFVPPIDVSVGPEGLRLVMDLPGARQEDLSVTVERGALIVRGNKTPGKKTLDEEPGSVLRREREYGSFARTIPLPDEADLANVTARLRDGELRVTGGRRAEAPPRRVEIAVE
jgi:HSP20 family protein